MPSPLVPLNPQQAAGTDASTTPPYSAVTVASQELRRRLNQRQLTMLAIGGAIGVGLFLGSGVTIQLAGPGVILSYLIGAIIALIVACALVEMAVVHPDAGSFGVYAETYLSHWAGFAVRATYGFVETIAIGAEVTAVAIYFAFWFPGVPQWVWVVAVSIALIAINTLQVGRFGEFEYWFALIKVVAILAFIAIGAAFNFESVRGRQSVYRISRRMVDFCRTGWPASGLRSRLC